MPKLNLIELMALYEGKKVIVHTTGGDEYTGTFSKLDHSSLRLTRVNQKPIDVALRYLTTIEEV